MFGQTLKTILPEPIGIYLPADILNASHSQTRDFKLTDTGYIPVRFPEVDPNAYIVSVPPSGRGLLDPEPESGGKAYGIILRDKPDASCNLASWSETVKVLQELLILE